MHALTYVVKLWTQILCTHHLAWITKAWDEQGSSESWYQQTRLFVNVTRMCMLVKRTLGALMPLDVSCFGNGSSGADQE